MRHAFIPKNSERLLTIPDIESPIDGAALTQLADGRYVAVWSEDNHESIRGCLVSATGQPLGSAFEISTPVTTPGGDILSQYEPTVTARADGGFMVAWTAEEYNSGYNTGRNVKARQFDAEGNPLDDPYAAAYRVVDGMVTTSSWEHQPSLGTLPDGKIAMAYQYDRHVYLRIYDTDGMTILDGDERVDGESTLYYHSPQITVLDGGDIALTWVGNDDSASSIQARLFTADGSPIGPEWTVNTDTFGSQASPAITALAGGGFAVAWYTPYDEAALTHTASVRVQVYDAEGHSIGGERRVSDDDNYGSTEDIALTALPDGGFVVAFSDYTPWTTLSDVYAQRFDAEGQKLGETLRINQVLDGRQELPRVEAGEDGSVTFTWSTAGEDGTYRMATRTMTAVEIDGDPTNRADAIALSASGDEMLSLKRGHDWLEAASGRDKVQGNAGNDTILGGAGKDRLLGSKGKDDLRGEAGNDKLYGQNGNDVLSGGTGRDTMEGGAGKDMFVFDPDATNHGKDRVRDFENGRDMIVIDSEADISFDEIDIRKVKKNAVLSYEGDDFAVLEGVDVDDLGAEDFTFGL